MFAKYFAFLGAVSTLIVGYVIWTQPKTTSFTPNLNVNEEAFHLLKKEMSKNQVLAILGAPHQTRTGRIVAVERPQDPKQRFGIQETAQSENPLLVFRGVDDENILGLFAADKLIAVEFRLGRTAVLYNGGTSEISDRECLAVDRDRVDASAVDDEESRRLRQRIDAFRKKQALRKVVQAIESRPAAAAPPLVAPAQQKSASRPSESNPFGEIHTWTDATGAHQIEAELLNLRDGIVQLKRADGKPIAIPLGKLSDADQEFVLKQTAEPNAVTVATTGRSGPVTGAAPSTPPRQGGAAGPGISAATVSPDLFQVELPSGKTLTQAVPTFEPPQPWPDKLFPPVSPRCSLPGRRRARCARRLYAGQDPVAGSHGDAAPQRSSGDDGLLCRQQAERAAANLDR